MTFRTAEVNHVPEAPLISAEKKKCIQCTVAQGVVSTLKKGSVLTRHLRVQPLEVSQRLCTG